MNHIEMVLRMHVELDVERTNGELGLVLRVYFGRAYVSWRRTRENIALYR
jgi:hypothetical protein